MIKNADAGKGVREQSSPTEALLVDTDRGMSVVDSFPCRAWRDKRLDHVLVEQSWLPRARLIERPTDICNKVRNYLRIFCFFCELSFVFVRLLGLRGQAGGTEGGRGVDFS